MIADITINSVDLGCDERSLTADQINSADETRNNTIGPVYLVRDERPFKTGRFDLIRA